MSTLDYGKYERTQLLQIMKEIPVELENRDKTMKKELRKRVQKIVEEAGYSLDDVLTTNKSSKPVVRKAPAKYRDPENEESTWTGRGRKPLWVIAALDSGKALEDLLI
ncbi:MAG: H-NS family nucleoid-associated regulatory protein [Leucothrix sp.]